MNVYVESNFVLELAFLQEQCSSCEKILSLCEARRIQLLIPAYSLAEPYETLTRRQKRRKRIKEIFDAELRQIARTSAYVDRLGDLHDLTALLIKLADEEEMRFEDVRSRLMRLTEVIPLDASVVSVAAMQYQQTHGFSPQDALVFSSVLSHLERVSAPQSCFLNRDSKDFDNQIVVEQLNGYDCKLLPRFDDGHDFILNALR